MHGTQRAWIHCRQSRAGTLRSLQAVCLMNCLVVPGKLLEKCFYFNRSLTHGYSHSPVHNPYTAFQHYTFTECLLDGNVRCYLEETQLGLSLRTLKCEVLTSIQFIFFNDQFKATGIVSVWDQQMITVQSFCSQPYRNT